MKIRLNSLGVTLSGILALTNIAGLIYIAMEAYGVSRYLGTKTSFSMAEAAYLGALWTEVVAKAGMGILLNVVVFGWILLNVELYDERRDVFRHQVVDGIRALAQQDEPRKAA